MSSWRLLRAGVHWVEVWIYCRVWTSGHQVNDFESKGISVEFVVSSSKFCMALRGLFEALMALSDGFRGFGCGSGDGMVSTKGLSGPNRALRHMGMQESCLQLLIAYLRLRRKFLD